jgi:para-aminobenzoate synthetase
MRTLLIDNYDSFTYNLFQLLWEVGGTEPVVVRNDEAEWGDLAGEGFEAVVISPGPGRPERERDFGVCAAAIRGAELPLLGVCLGHQGLGWVHGSPVVAAPTAMHGRIRAVEHSGSQLFAGIPRRFEAVRYHSLCLSRPLPDCLEEIAWSDDGVAMAVAHRSLPQWGVQFHPESVASEHGRRLLTNFRDLALAFRGSLSTPYVHKEPRNGSSGARDGLAGGEGSAVAEPPAASKLELRWRRLDLRPDAQRLFAELYGNSESAFWLDSSRPGDDARFSFLGDDSGPLGATVSYDVEAGEVRIERGGAVERRREPVLDYVDRELHRLAIAPPELPFQFACGFAGYLGYELKADCGGGPGHRSPHADAALVFAGRMVAIDHDLGHTYLLALVEPGGEGEGERWLAAMEARLRMVAAVADAAAEPAAPPSAGHPGLARSRERYLEDIATCQGHLTEGESYEICLTNSISTPVVCEPLDLYKRLRHVNPAPFAAYLRFGELAVLSSSPERFLAIDGAGGVEAKPIKGTSRRSEDREEDARLARHLAADEKNRAENLMIVDLLRNDLGAVCAMGSVEVPSLMAVESFETVHQLVSTVRGRLRPGLGAPDCIRACFPPGSMTGAPKLRTTEIIDELEGAPRGVYSGAIGYLGLGGGCDVSVAIRTIVLDRGSATIGAGGAIVLDSDPEQEYEEMLLKAAAPLRAIDPGLDPASISLPDQRQGAAVPPPASVSDLTS